MLTDAEARSFLHAAAATIEVEPAGPLPAPARRPTWPVVAATAAVLVVVALATFLLRPGGDTAPARPSPDDHTFRLGPDQVPSVFGYSTDDAVTMLEERGFHVLVSSGGFTSEVAMECGEARGRAIGTMPAVGTIVEPGSEILVQTSGGGRGGTDAFCVPQPGRDEAWAFLDFANGRGPAPDFADQVSYFDGHRPGVVIDGSALEDPSSWTACDEPTSCESLATMVSRMTNQVERFRTGSEPLSFHVPFLRTQLTTKRSCGPIRPEPLVGRQGLLLDLDVSTPGLGSITLDCQQIILFLDSGGRIDGVHAVSQPTSENVPGPPDVTGNTIDDARERLADLGYAVQEVPRTDCNPVGMVVSQSPGAYEPGHPYDSGPVALALVDDTGRCNAEEVHPPSEAP